MSALSPVDARAVLDQFSQAVSEFIKLEGQKLGYFKGAQVSLADPSSPLSKALQAFTKRYRAQHKEVALAEATIEATKPRIKVNVKKGQAIIRPKQS